MEGKRKKKPERVGWRSKIEGRGEREREYWFQDSLLSLMLRVSCSEKPADRSPSRLCRRTGAPRRLVRYDNIHLDSSILTLVLLISILSSNTPYPPVLTVQRLTDWQIHFPLFTTLPIAIQFSPSKSLSKSSFLWPLFKMEQSMRVGSLSMQLSSFVIFQSHFRVKRESDTKNETISCDIWVCYCGTIIVPFFFVGKGKRKKQNVCYSWFIFLVISNCAWESFDRLNNGPDSELFFKCPYGIIKYDEMFVPIPLLFPLIERK